MDDDGLHNAENLGLQRAFLSDAVTIAKIARVLQLSRALAFAPDGERSHRFACPINPGGRAWFARGADRRYRYATQAVGSPVEFRTIAALYAHLLSGQLVEEDDDSEATDGRVAGGAWVTRLFADAGLIALPRVTMALPSAGASNSEQAFHEAITLLFRCREWVFPGCPVPLAQRFVGPWAGVSPPTAWRGVERLAHQRVVWNVATRPAPYPRHGLKLYLPGGVAPPAEWERRYGADMKRARTRKLDAAMNGPTRQRGRHGKGALAMPPSSI